MSDTISPENEAYLREALSRGDYVDRGQALDEAVELLKTRDALLRDLRAGTDQLDRGEAIAAEEVFARVESRIRAIAERRAPDSQ